MYLFWSRDKISWVSEDMTPDTDEIYMGIIPTQDGTDNVYYNYGAGKLYWFVRMRNDAYEYDTLFSSQEPNTEIAYHELGSETTTDLEVSDNESIVLGILDIPLAIVKTVLDPTADPFVRIVLLILAVSIIFVIASGGRGLGFLRGLFRK